MQVLNIKRINKYLLQIKKGYGYRLNNLFEYTYSNLYNIAYAYLINKSYADDVISQAYLNVVNYIHTYDSKLNGYNWLYTIVKNCAMEFNKRESKKLDMLCDLDENIEDKFNVLEYVLLKDAVDTLNDYEKDLIFKRYWEGLTVKEIAIDSNMSTSTIYSHLDNVYKKLREFYKDNS